MGKELKACEISLKIRLKEDITYRNLPLKLSQGINKCFLIDKKSMILHKKNRCKNYSYSLLTPIEKDYYKADKFYDLTIRFLSLELANSFYEGVKTIDNTIFTLVVAKKKEIKSTDNIIKTLETINPTIITDNNRYVDSAHLKKKLVIDRIVSNTNHKMNDFYGKNNITKYNFIEDVEPMSFQSSVFNYKKNGVLIGNKLRVKVKQDEKSQELAFIAYVSGLLEKNSLSFGFCKIR